MQIEVIDPTRLRDSISCLRFYYWRHERHYIPIKPRMPLIHGSGVHASLAAHYEGQRMGQCLLEYEKIYDAGVNPYRSLMEEDDPKRNPVRWMEQFTSYVEFYKDDPWKPLVLNNGRPAVEVPFFYLLTDDLALGGIIDLVVQWLGQIMVVDHKTTSYMNSRWTESFMPNHQFSAYLLAANELLQPAQPIRTLMVNAILSHSTENRPEKMFGRFPTTRSPYQLEYFKEMIVSWWEVVRHNRKTGCWAQNDHYCTEWSGCEYKPLCEEVQANHRRLIPSPAMYREEVWDPITDLRKHGLEVTV